MRIAFAGTHGVGKTTLLNSLKDKVDTNFITEISRDLIKKLGNPKDMDMADKSVFQYILMQEQLIKEQQDDFISDRSLFDIVAYSKGINLYDSILQKCITKHNYDIVFYIPIEFGLEKDGVRFEDEKFQKEIDERIVVLLKKFHPNYITITGTVRERLDKVLNEINLYYNLK